MKNYYFGSMDEYIQTGYAPTDRASCKSCKLRIDKSAVRMGYIMDSDHFSGKNWYHLSCFTLRPLFKDVDPKEQIFKLDELEKEDRDDVVQHVTKEVERLKSGVKSLKRKGKSKKKVLTKSKDEEEETEVPVAPVQRAKSEPRSKSKSKSAKKSIGKRSASKAKVQVKRAKKKKAKKTSGLSQAQKAKFKEFLDQFMAMTINQLKEILAKNGQTKTGIKIDLAMRCADGKLLGRIPMCPECGGGRPKFDQDTVTYICRGYMDDDQFKNCNKIYTMTELARQPWIE